MPGEFLYAPRVLGAVLRVGGTGLSVPAPRPALAGSEPPRRLLLRDVASRRFFLLVWQVMPAFPLASWAPLAIRHGGFRRAGWRIRAMRSTGLVTAGVFLGPWRAFQAARAGGEPRGAAADADRVRQPVAVYHALGLPTVAVAAWGRFGG